MAIAWRSLLLSVSKLFAQWLLLLVVLTLLTLGAWYFYDGQTHHLNTAFLYALGVTCMLAVSSLFTGARDQGEFHESYRYNAQGKLDASRTRVAYNETTMRFCQRALRLGVLLLLNVPMLLLISIYCQDYFG